MNSIKVLIVSLTTLASAVVASAQLNLLVSRSTGTLDYGYGYAKWSTFTSRLNTAAAGSTVNIDTAANLSDALAVANAEAIFLDQRWTSGSLSAAEITNLTSFIASGRRVVLIGENASWTAWDDQILGLVGDNLSTDSTATALPVGSNALTAGVTSISLPAAGVSSGATGTALFDVNFSRLYGPSANVLTILDVNLLSDTYLTDSSNLRFADNVIAWLLPARQSPGPVAVPEPSTYGLIGCIALLCVVALRRGRKKTA